MRVRPLMRLVVIALAVLFVLCAPFGLATAARAASLHGGAAAAEGTEVFRPGGGGSFSSGGSRSSGSARRAILAGQYAAAQAVPRSVSLDPLRARDPNLTEASIVERVQHMSVILREAWCGGDMRGARAFVSDGVFSRFAVQLQL